MIYVLIKELQLAGEAQTAVGVENAEKTYYEDWWVGEGIEDEEEGVKGAYWRNFEGDLKMG